ncbi:hypothetical protein SmB9_34770 [Sphingosinicella microcystinivorans]|uniref:Uncharacterized protein n=2 Tax=Sphingosinicella microcystinivorans TaxID=335406 RepID=A0AAD1G2J9_SPHMI|nr:hypothetical protein DFR51_2654 [Sphingosinicella microcystinivorans]BBE35819.1 hypothetical protein SmB9_34770 [Sphingosinicella microcystinivorans]
MRSKPYLWPRMSTATIFGRIRARIAAVERRQWVIGSLSVLMTFIIMFTFLIENRFGYLPPDPIIAYFKNWEDGRSRAEALAEQEEEERLMQEQADAIAAQLDINADKAAADPAAQPAAQPETKEPASE